MIRPMAKFDAERFSRPLTYILTGRLRYILQKGRVGVRRPPDCRDRIDE
jgi:hypothetical protein